MENIIQQISIWALPVLFAITVHEAAHAYAAKHFGDPTAFLMGRMTLNPLKHIDPMGTIILPLICVLLPGGFLFGWAKPVPVNFGALRDPRANGRWVAAAGPLSNFGMAVVWVLLLKLAFMAPGSYFARPLYEMALAGIQINMVLMLVNLLPIPPLDGGRILVFSLPRDLANKVASIEPYGMIILVVALVSGALGWVLEPMRNVVLSVLGLLL
ncbi:site-2 protease family protein [Chitinibacteraceae bacterium HSL-7]